MTGSRSPVQIQINRIAKRLHGLVNGLRAFIAGTVGTGGGQRSGSAQHTQGGRGIRNAHALRDLAGGGIGTYRGERAIVIGHGDRRERARHEHGGQAVQRHRQIQMQLLHAFNRRQ